MSGIQHLELKEQLFMTLIKLRLNFEFTNLGHLFGISQQDAGTLFADWINYMYYTLGSISLWPHRDVITSMMPPEVKEKFPNTFVILDGTELKVQRSSALDLQSQCYSDYKSAPTLKGLVGVDPRGSLIFASTLFTGSISDKQITRDSGLYDVLRQLLDSGRLQRGDGIMVDKGFNIQAEVEELGLKLNIPPKAPSKGQMSAADVAITKVIAKHRVHVERSISRIKKFKILSDRFDLSRIKLANQIWFVCCSLTCFMPLLIQDK